MGRCSWQLSSAELPADGVRNYSEVLWTFWFWNCLPGLTNNTEAAQRPGFPHLGIYTLPNQALSSELPQALESFRASSCCFSSNLLVLYHSILVAEPVLQSHLIPQSAPCNRTAWERETNGNDRGSILWEAPSNGVNLTTQAKAKQPWPIFPSLRLCLFSPAHDGPGWEREGTGAVNSLFQGGQFTFSLLVNSISLHEPWMVCISITFGGNEMQLVDILWKIRSVSYTPGLLSCLNGVRFLEILDFSPWLWKCSSRTNQRFSEPLRTCWELPAPLMRCSIKTVSKCLRPLEMLPGLGLRRGRRGRRTLSPLRGLCLPRMSTLLGVCHVARLSPRATVWLLGPWPSFTIIFVTLSKLLNRSSLRFLLCIMGEVVVPSRGIVKIKWVDQVACSE